MTFYHEVEEICSQIKHGDGELDTDKVRYLLRQAQGYEQLLREILSEHVSFDISETEDGYIQYHLTTKSVVERDTKRSIHTFLSE